MTALSDVVNVSVTAAAANPTAPGFGTALILSNSNVVNWTERVREYADMTALAVDFAATTGEYKAAAKYFSANPRPEKVLVGRGALRPTQRFAITPVAVNSYTYRITVNGTVLSFTSDASATVTEVIAGLLAAINGLGLPVTASDQTTFLQVVANTPGYFFSVGTSDPNLTLIQNHVDPGVATDLAAIQLERSDWYGLLTIFNSYACVSAAAAWVEANGKIYAAQTSDSAVPNTVNSGTDDIGELVRSSAYDHTMVVYSPNADDFADAAAMGKDFPKLPGVATLKFKPLAGVSVGTYTATQLSNMRAKYVNFYDTAVGVPMLSESTMGSGKFWDFVRYLDYQKAMVGTDVFTLLASADKIGFDDRGIQQIVGTIRGRLQADEDRGVLAAGWTVSAPKAAAVSTVNKNARHLTPVTYVCTYTGAIHKVTINGTVNL